MPHGDLEAPIIIQKPEPKIKLPGSAHYDRFCQNHALVLKNDSDVDYVCESLMHSKRTDVLQFISQQIQFGCPENLLTNY